MNRNSAFWNESFPSFFLKKTPHLLYSLACGGEYELLEGRFFPPTYSNQYSANEHCNFHVKTFVGSRIMVAFSKFKLEEKWAESCVDYLEVMCSILIMVVSFPRFPI
jgi:hypothetical protein